MDYTQQAVDEFLELCKIPHPDFHTEEILAYLQRVAKELGYEHYRDDYGNFWMDIPATPGYEERPRVILQAHMDMVCVSEPGRDYSPETSPIIPIVDTEKNIITADGTSLGADNGIGIGIILAIAKGDAPHGPLRALITTDEEDGLFGAEALPAEALDGAYLINLDSENVGEIFFASAGGQESRIRHRYEQSALSAEEGALQLSISNLLGGHSGDDIDKNRLSATTVLRGIMSALREASIAFRIVSIDSGVVSNAIVQHGTLTLAVAKEQIAKAKDIAMATAAKVQESYPNEDMKAEVSDLDSEDLKALSAEDSLALLDFLNSMRQGVISRKEKLPEQVRSSMSLGITHLYDGEMFLATDIRSCVTDDILELDKELRAQSEAMGFAYEQYGLYPGWDGDPDCELVSLIFKGFEVDGTVKPSKRAIHAGLECSWFVKKNEKLQVTSIGPTMTGVHSTSETLYVDSVTPTISSVLYCLEHIA